MLITNKLVTLNRRNSKLNCQMRWQGEIGAGQITQKPKSNRNFTYNTLITALIDCSINKGFTQTNRNCYGSIKSCDKHQVDSKRNDGNDQAASLRVIDGCSRNDGNARTVTESREQTYRANNATFRKVLTRGIAPARGVQVHLCVPGGTCFFKEKNAQVDHFIKKKNTY